MRMRTLSQAILAGVSASLVASAGSAEARTVYTWKTETGAVAFADDLKRVPEKYRSAVETRELSDLASYKRLTRQAPADRDAAARELEERIARLRQINEGAPGDAVEEGSAGAMAPAFALSPSDRYGYSAPRLGADAPPVATAPGTPLPVVVPGGSTDPGFSEQRTTVSGGLIPSFLNPFSTTTTTRRVVRRGGASNTPQVSIPVHADPSDPNPVVVERKRYRDRDSMSTRHITVVRQGDRVLSIVKPRSHVEPAYWGDEEDLEQPNR
jgi:hypothetical protein